MGTQTRLSASRPFDGRRLISVLVGLAAGLLVTGCGTGSSDSGGQAGVQGAEMAKPGSAERFFVDFNESGNTSRLLLVETFWARLVDIHDIDGSGNANPVPVFRDFAIGQDIDSDGANYRLETNPITQKQKLIILRQKTDTAFRTLLDQAADAVQTIVPKNDNGTSSPSFTFLARNACVVLRFNDVLSDTATAAANLANNVKVLTGYPPTIPFDARVVFDRHHGAIVGGEFHSSRVLVDLTVSQADAAGMSSPLPINSVGLPAGVSSTGDPNVSIRIPTRTTGTQVSILRALSGARLSFDQNGPNAPTADTRDIVRAMRGGNADDIDNGFLRDGTRPQILGSWPFATLTAVDDPAGSVGYDFLLSLQFSSSCQDLLDEGDMLEIGSNVFEVSALTAAPDGMGIVTGIQAHSVAELPITNLATITGVAGSFLSTYDKASSVPDGCWIRFTPEPAAGPTTDVSTTAVASIRFTEAMDPAGVSALDSMLVVRSNMFAAPTPTSIVVGVVNPNLDLDEFQFVPVLPFNHLQGSSETYHIRFDRAPRDLAGNEIVANLPIIEFTLDALDPTSSNGGVVMRFEEFDEMRYSGMSTPGIRGQLIRDLDDGTIRPRDVKFAGYAADRNQPIVANFMGATPLAGGVAEPLTGFGARVQTIYRHCDFGWLADDETKHNMDVIGVNWAPVAGQVNSDYFADFEMVLSSTGRIAVNESAPAFMATGLQPGPTPFSANVLNEVDDTPQLVHSRTQGYQISAIDAFRGVTGTTMVPYPFNRAGGPMRSYLWRNTGTLATCDPDVESVGFPTREEQNAGTDSWQRIINTNNPVPSIGLPLLMEFRAYPSAGAVGMNVLDVVTAVTGFFRAFSAGGTDSTGASHSKNPDQQTFPTGGFNPFSATPSASADGTFYIGQLDTVTRVSRAHTIWLDAGVGAVPGYLDPVVEPGRNLHPDGTALIIEFRGATSFSGNGADTKVIDALQIDYYGNIKNVSPVFLNSDAWTNDVSSFDSARYIQARLTFVNNIASRRIIELSALGFPFVKN